MNPLEKAKPNQKATTRLEVDLFLDTPLVLNKRELEERLYPKQQLTKPEATESKSEKIQLIMAASKDGIK
jgi:hypothetical protein